MRRLGISGFGVNSQAPSFPPQLLGRGLRGFLRACAGLCLLLRGESNPAAAFTLMWIDPRTSAPGPTARPPVLLSYPLEPTKCFTGLWPL